MIDTHFNRMFGLLHPMVLSPLNPMSDWQLAAAVSDAGGLGLIHVGSQDQGALQVCFDNTGEDAVGWGVDISRLERTPEILAQLLDYRPRAILLYDGDPTPYVAQLREQKVPVICVVESVQMARMAIAAGVDIIAAHGNGGAGSGSGSRTTLSLLPEIADAIYASHMETLLLCSGGIADARSIAAALIMGADGVLMGTRLWATAESSLTGEAVEELVALSGDDVPCQVMSMQGGGPVARLWRGLGGPEAGRPIGEGVGMVRDAPSVEEILTSLTYKVSRLMIHIQRKVVE